MNWLRQLICGRTHEWIILVQADNPTPSETVTNWDVYEAAPQIADTPEDAIQQFQRDSGLTGEMKAIPLKDWR